MRNISFAISLFLLAAGQTSVLAGDLDKANKIVSGKDGDHTSKSRKNRTRVRRKDDNDDWEGNEPGDTALAEIALISLTFPWWGPYLLIEGDDYPTTLGFRGYPYEDGALGHVVYPGDDDEAFAAQMAGQLSMGLGYMGNDGWRATARGRWMHQYRFDVDVNVIGFGEFDNGDLDSATFFSGHVGYRFVQTDTLTMRTGIGGAFWQTQGLWAGGVDFYYGFDWFLVEPIVFSMNAEIGGLGKAFRFGFQGSMGALIGRTEIYLGWEHFVLAREEVVELGGPQAGVRIWL